MKPESRDFLKDYSEALKEAIRDLTAGKYNSVPGETTGILSEKFGFLPQTECGGILSDTGDILRETILLIEKSRTDALSGLKNCKYFEMELEKKFAEAGNKAIAMLDIDGFKKVNTRFGHSTGNSILKEFGEFLRKFETPEISVARYGGDEFTMFFSGKAALRGELENFNTSLFEQIKKVLFKTDQEKKIRLSFSIGYAAAGYPPEWRKTLKEAENAMFRAKGKNERAFLFS